MNAENPDLHERARIFRCVVPYFGKTVPASFLQKTATFIPGIERLHNLIEGIFKPAWSEYPLSIVSMLNSPYSDQVCFNADRTWWINYSPKAGSMEIAANAGMMRCLTNRQPILVVRQVSDKSSPEGARHRLLGLGYVEAYDPSSSLFRIRGLVWNELMVLLGLGEADALIETALRLESLEKWAPFEEENRALYKVSAERRDEAFRGIVLQNYGYSCAVSGQRFRTSRHIEADGAHIISKDVRGTDDPRNGLALARSVHWAFDRGILRISDQYEVVVNPKARHADTEAFPLMDLDRKRIRLPADPCYWPHPEALAWHKTEVFDRFEL